jgi:outer membrane protein assembly factor BamB
MNKRHLSLPLVLLLLVTCTEHPTDNRAPNPQSVAVLTQHNDNTRSGWNDSETALTTSNVNVQQFGAVFTLPVDDQVYAQPLVVGHVAVGGGSHNVVYIATVNNTLYAYDGDNGTLYWHRSFSAPGMRPPRNSDMTGACGGGYQDFSGNIGIVGTPVIDAATGTMYFVARSTTGSTFVQYLHAVSIVDGSEMAGGPTRITATASGNGDGSVNGVIVFDAQRQNQRQGLTLVAGVVYVTFSSHCDWGPYHGWILGYNAATLAQQVVYNATPNGYGGGMWESGTGMAADGDGNLYVVTGNGAVGDSADPTGPTNRAESALKLTPAGSTLRVASYFTPYDYQYLNDNDLDYGSMGGFLIPNSGYYLTGAKDGKLYLLNKDAMGGYTPSADQVQQVVQLRIDANMHCQTAYYNGSSREFIYVWSENDQLRAIPFDRAGNLLQAQGQIVSAGLGPTGQSGAILSVSSNGSKDGTGILWASYAASGDAEHSVSPGILRALDANDITRELWNNHQDVSRDGAGNYAKFSAPTIANGHVYLPTFSNRVVVYGLR